MREDPATQKYEVIVTMIETVANFREVPKVAERRATAIRDHFIAAGIAPTRVTTSPSVSPTATADSVGIRRQ